MIGSVVGKGKSKTKTTTLERSMSLKKTENKDDDATDVTSLALTDSLAQIKHPLENTWCFWYYTNQSKKSWEDNQVMIHSFNTVEDFWCLYHHLKPVCDLPLGHDYAIFKAGVPPLWEHPTNANGGRWLILLDKLRRATDDLWLDIVLTLIGENFANNDQIMGTVVTVRARNKIGIWTKDSSKETAIMEIGYKLKKVIGNKKLGYHKHDSSNNIYNL